MSAKPVKPGGVIQTIALDEHSQRLVNELRAVISEIEAGKAAVEDFGASTGIHPQGGLIRKVVATIRYRGSAQ